ncbi:probable methyltransferase BMT2 homolog [Copidosoma floridanum]|uniref:probable methyltransferase BMT2 homolog n=1 Tax=Copidosoma floridanum TaxID=29053 RepID=UPI0006C99672|nr:probable methyltransferase BMT2 homolog [Copidosoma floridanum]
MEEKREIDVKTDRKKVNKASEKHKQLAHFIKSVHTQLRKDSEVFGAKEAWNTHIAQKEKLKEYAKSMYQLATKHWGQKSQSSEKISCRVEWIKSKCKDYFFNGGVDKYDEKEQHLLEKDTPESCRVERVENFEAWVISKITVLDVGSCYNPFATENSFIVTAVDIAPYSSDVLKCDFLNLNVGSERKVTECNNALIELPKNSCDVVIFSLLLEYIPCPDQRFSCCKKAYELLRDRGILFIATPDSKHQGSNAKIINTSWKVVLAKLGFMRICYEKLPHLHCMMFRKCCFKEAAMKKINWKKIPENDELYSLMKIFIPQDFQSKNVNDDTDDDLQQFEHNDQESLALFNELPCEI